MHAVSGPKARKTSGPTSPDRAVSGDDSPLVVHAIVTAARRATSVRQAQHEPETACDDSAKLGHYRYKPTTEDTSRRGCRYLHTDLPRGLSPRGPPASPPPAARTL